MAARVSGQTRQFWEAEKAMPSNIVVITLLISVSHKEMLTPKYGIPVAGDDDDSDQPAVAAISHSYSGAARQARLYIKGASRKCRKIPGATCSPRRKQDLRHRPIKIFLKG